MPLKALEKAYYHELSAIAAQLGMTETEARKKQSPYALEDATTLRLQPHRSWVISGISGSGKTTATKYFERHGLIKLPNVTTRARRIGEKDSEYHFLASKKFLLLRKAGVFYHPHRRNGVWQAILKKDLQRLAKGKQHFYLDKSVASAIALTKALAKTSDIGFIYLLPPNFRDLWERIDKREQRRKEHGEKRLSRGEILDRFAEEIIDMRKSVKLPYSYFVNDDPKRLETFITKQILRGQ